MATVLLTNSVTANEQLQQRIAKVKAAYIYNVIKFTHWPNTDHSSTEPIRVGIVGRDRVAEFLFAGFKSRKAQNRHLLVEEVVDKASAESDLQQVAESLSAYHVVYFSAPVDESEKHLIRALEGTPILLTTGAEDQLRSGGMVGFLFDRENDKLRLLVNLENMQRSGLTMSSKLLKFAKIIEQ